jgi:hypothetical protein
MKQYVIDGFTLKDYTALKHYFDTYLEAATVGGIYWLELDSGILTEIQAGHNVIAWAMPRLSSATGWLTGQTPFLKNCPFVFDIGSE